MAFNQDRFTRTTLAFNSGAITLADASITHGPALFTYASATDDAATIAAANYFGAASVVYDLAVGDIIMGHASDASFALRVTAVNRTAGTATTAGMSLTGSVNTANIVDLAVTTAKLADAAVTSLKIQPSIIQHARVSLAAAQWNGMFAAPFQLVEAQGADSLIVLRDFRINLDYGGSVFANGGAIALQLDDTAESGGVLATATYAAATFIGHTADTSFSMAPVLTSMAHSAVLNEGLYISNATGAFTGGAGSALDIDVWYSVVEMFA